MLEKLKPDGPKQKAQVAERTANPGRFGAEEMNNTFVTDIYFLENVSIISKLFFLVLLYTRWTPGWVTVLCQFGLLLGLVVRTGLSENIDILVPVWVFLYRYTVKRALLCITNLDKLISRFGLLALQCVMLFQYKNHN